MLHTPFPPQRVEIGHIFALLLPLNVGCCTYTPFPHQGLEIEHISISEIQVDLQTLGMDPVRREAFQTFHKYLVSEVIFALRTSVVKITHV